MLSIDCEHGLPKFLCRRCGAANSSARVDACGEPAAGPACAPGDALPSKLANDAGEASGSEQGKPQSDSDEVKAANTANDEVGHPTTLDLSKKSKEMNAPLYPNRADIDRHLAALFSPTFVHPYPDARIEIAYADPATGEISSARTFSVFELSKAGDFAERKNREGCNVYVAPALRQAEVQGRAGRNDVVGASRIWTDFDQPGDRARVDALVKEAGLQPSEVVVTGNVPHCRFQAYFEVTGNLTPEQLERGNTHAKMWLGGDNVQNPDRLMRLAGTINYPTKSKLERGYVAEVVTLHINLAARPCTVEQLAKFAGLESDDSGGLTGRRSRTDDELIALLEASRLPGNWHNSMRDAIATMIGRGWSDLQIRLACGPECKGGPDDPDLDALIDGARKKWSKPDPDIAQYAEADDDLGQGDERSANEAPVAHELPTIQLGPRISLVTTATQRMLIEARAPFYRRGGELVRPIIRRVKAAHGQPTKTAQLKAVDVTYMRDTMCRHTHWLRFAAKSGWVETKAPLDVARTLLARDGLWEFPEIIGVISCPTMRPDGSLLVKQGYDLATRLLLVEPPPLPPIPDEPTRDDALYALALLEDLMCESPFVDDASRAAALSGIITPVVRGAMPVVPMHAFSAPTAGTGKNFHCDLSAAVSTGQRRIPVMAAGNDEEMEKRLVSILLTGQPLFSIDNVNRELKGEFLAQAIEQQFLDLRPLGASKVVRVEAGGVTIFATGNNIIIAGADLSRRTIMARLDAEMEKPQLRQFKYNPIQSILDDRGKYIAACLTICRAYIVAGRPGLLPKLASFEAWSDTVRSALVWLGCGDPLETMEDIRADDPDRELLGAVLREWAEHHGVGSGSDVTLNVIVDTAMKTNAEGYENTSVYPEFNAAVRAAAKAIGNVKVETTKFGIWCRGNKGRIVDGLRLMNKPSKRGGAATWWVEEKK